MEILYVLFSKIVPRFLTQNPINEEQAWNSLWFPILQAFSLLCVDSRLEIRNYAITYLQRSLLSSYLDSLSPITCHNCFQQLIFPLTLNILRPVSELGLDSGGLEETRLRASALLAKIFLQYLTKIIQLPNWKQLWWKILHFTEMYMKADGSELLAEAVHESLKNILLVMSATGTFSPGVNTHGEDIWHESWTKIDSFAPHLKLEFHRITQQDSNTIQLSQGSVSSV